MAPRNISVEQGVRSWCFLFVVSKTIAERTIGHHKATRRRHSRTSPKVGTSLLFVLLAPHVSHCSKPQNQLVLLQNCNSPTPTVVVLARSSSAEIDLTDGGVSK